ncbi:myozenin-1b [Megalobrama amblycephala]|uniref:myozenin-1b n=1 Tax=Megalobrama amblycephala TaxID=75352 RepID=UPI00201426A3|nr:myozenin-1b [Megalobrama amblycephala]XP_048026518.1 myozenin-1b [Megalobrama amblycephala]
MPVSGTPDPTNKRKKPSKIITDFSNISQHDQEDENAEASELDLGTKIKAPKDVMLEELSLMKNKGSKMFKMRQQRVEKFIVSDENLQNLQNLVPSLEFEMTAPPESSPKPEPPQEEVNAEAEKKRQLEYVKTYISPWEHAMKDDEKLKETMRWKMPGPQVHKELPKYKSFNRMALPFGGFEKATRLVTFEPPEIKVTDEEPQPVSLLQNNICCRPSFNRTPIGWTCNEEHSHIHMELDNIPFDGETDDL